jgi:hypothetical protein
MTGMAQNWPQGLEGIENEDQLALLRSLRCESAQGFLFAKPLNADTAAELLKTGLPSRPQRPRHEVTAFPSRREVPVSRLLAGSRRFAPPRTLLMAAAVLALLTLSGLVVFFKGDSPASGSSSAPSPLEHAVPSMTSDAAGGSPAAAPAASTVKPASFDVLHLHRIGSCRGRLVVSRDGVAFVPAEGRDDAFVLKYADFVHGSSDNTLTIRTATKSYRLKALASGGKDDDGRQLRAVVQRIARLRRG